MTPAKKTTPTKKAATKKAAPAKKKAAPAKKTTAAKKAAPVEKAAPAKKATAGAAAKPERVQGPASYFPSIEKKYGRPIAEWKAIIRAGAGPRHSDYVNMLKTDYGMGHGHATALVADTLAEDRAAG